MPSLESLALGGEAAPPKLIEAPVLGGSWVVISRIIGFF